MIPTTKRLTLPGGLTIFHTNVAEARSIHDEIFHQNCYAHSCIDLQPGATIIDVGANVGLATLYFHRRFPDAQFVCVEPIPSVVDLLQANLKYHKINATVLTAAASDSRGTAIITYYPKITAISGMHADPDEDRQPTLQYLRHEGMRDADIEFLTRDLFDSTTLECRTLTVSDMIRDHGLDTVELLKIDAQKSEIQVLQGIDGQHWDRIQRVCAEVHDINGRLLQATSMLQARGFRVEVEQRAQLKHTVLHDLVAFRA